MQNSKIEWTDLVWNPMTGCSPVSSGCDHCYARRMANRLKGRSGYPKENPFKVILRSGRLDEPLAFYRKKSRRVFVCSMGDLFHEEVPFAYIRGVFARMIPIDDQSPVFFVLTKRPHRMKEYFEWNTRAPYDEEFGHEWPLPNVWIGTSAENQEALDYRAPFLIKTPAHNRFLSLEPLLGEINIAGYTTRMKWVEDKAESRKGYTKIFDHSLRSVPRQDLIQWVVVGGETGPGARPCKPEWVRAIRDQTKAAGLPFFFKSWGRHLPEGAAGENVIDAETWQELPPLEKYVTRSTERQH